MSDMKSIWHKLPEQPENGRDVIEKWHHLGIHYTHFVAKNGIAEDNPFTDAWCYLDDLLALETELERTKKQLEIANDTLRHTDWFFDGDYNVYAKDMHKEIKYAIKAITALKQKE